MNTIALKAATHRSATPSFGAGLSAVLGRTYAALVLWHRRREQRRDFARCAAVVGHRFAADTLISSSDLPRNPARPFWDDAILVQQHPGLSILLAWRP